ncbi:MAG: hypothetical protein V1750_02860 [Acidobacteriota bacterium]
MLHIYQLITGLVVLLAVRSILAGRTLGQQLTGALVLVPLLLRLALIK